jgi:hypothetical protein
LKKGKEMTVIGQSKGGKIDCITKDKNRVKRGTELNGNTVKPTLWKNESQFSKLCIVTAELATV